MFKAIFFDFYNTLVHFSPTSEEIQKQACNKFGITANKQKLSAGYKIADNFFNQENSINPIFEKNKKDQDSFFFQYEKIILETAGITVSTEIIKKIWNEVYTTPRELLLFEDVLPTLTQLKKHHLKIGIITNNRQNIIELTKKLKIHTFLNVIVRSCDVGFEKPHPKIFKTALNKLKIPANKTLHIGDQPLSDLQGAKQVGITPILLDREKTSEIKVFPIINSLIEIETLLNTQ